MRYVCLLVSILLSNAVAADLPFKVIGELNANQATDFSTLHVEMRPIGTIGTAGERGFVTFDGHFEVPNLQSGQYELSVTNDHGEAIHREIVTVNPSDPRLQVRLTIPEVQRPLDGSVSVHQLTHKPPKQARKAFDKACALANDGDAQGSIELLQKAIAIDPEYVPAINNLGVRYTRLGRAAEAVEMFERALAIDPHAGMVQSNLAQALIYAGKPAAAETAARRAIELDRSGLQPVYLLGLSLVLQGKYTPETVASLRRTEHISDRARLALGLALARTGSGKEAKVSLSECLRSQDLTVRTEATRLLSVLR